MNEIDIRKLKLSLSVSTHSERRYIDDTPLGEMLSGLIFAIETLQQNQDELLEKIKILENNYYNSRDCTDYNP